MRTDPRPVQRHALPQPPPRQDDADVCLLVEGCYPYVAGGVSSWLDWLIRQLPERRFAVVAIIAGDSAPEPRYELPENVTGLYNLTLATRLPKLPAPREPKVPVAPLAELICRIIDDGDASAAAALCALIDGTAPGDRRLARITDAPALSLAQLLNSRFAWELLTACYQRLTPSASFPDFYWAWRTLIGGLFAVLTAKLPPARTYHTISTGYAGLAAARAALATGRPCAITEHGIYTNERRIDLLMAEWIPDSIDPGLVPGDQRLDIRGFWIRVFEGYAKLCYALCRRITTLYGENQVFQKTLGAPLERLEVIPNGIHFERFASIEPSRDRPPTVALIGRVVPIKDIKTFIATVAELRRQVPELRALLLGPTDEDPEYHAQCQSMVDSLGLGGAFIFTGKVDIIEYMAEIDVLLLTSISEAQPLVLLEAGAAGIPCVATDVGSCREIIEGLPEEDPKLGAGGSIVPLMSPEATAAATAALLQDEALRRQCGAIMRERVRRYFTSEASAARYAALYDQLAAL